VSFTLKPRETLAIVGESGCGKSITALSLMRLVPDPPGRIAGGSVKLAGVDLLALSEEAMRSVRGKDVAMIFQEPMTSLNPVLTIGSQIAEALLLHEDLSRQEAWDKAIEMLRIVRIPDPKQRAREYPHQLSGGMRQRAMIAMALACNPKVLIADEPTTALDVTIQAQILDLILDLQKKLGTAVILITHDLGVVAETAQRVIVMYAGRKVEEAPVEDLFARPQHPYTRGLLASIPRLALMRGDNTDTGERLQEIPGMVPALSNLPEGCVFAPRCAYVIDICRERYPDYEEKRPQHWAACWRSGELFGGGHA
jgi:peptide/nickel transport system ATP-binding protein